MWGAGWHGKTWITACDQPIIEDEDHPEEFWRQYVDGIPETPVLTTETQRHREQQENC